MTDEEVEKIIKSNMNLQMNLTGIRADFEEKLQRTWVGLTDDEIKEIHHLSFGKDIAIATGLTEAKLKEKNT